MTNDSSSERKQRPSQTRPFDETQAMLHARYFRNLMVCLEDIVELLNATIDETTAEMLYRMRSDTK